MPTVLIVIEGGVIQNVNCTGGPVDYVVKDFDNIDEAGAFDSEPAAAKELLITEFEAAVFADIKPS